MLIRFKKFLGKLSKLKTRDLLELFLHPVLQPFMLISVWFKSLWSSKILLWGQWSRYHGFHAQNAVNSLFYRTQWININRYGRLSNSPIIGLGNFPMANWWHLSSLASYFYANAGAITTLLGTLALVFTHWIWFQSVDAVWLGIITLLLFFCSTMYAMAFARQNYQILAWIFLPTILFGLLTKQLVISTIALFLASLFGITAFAVGSIFVVVTAVHQQQPLALCVLLPSIIPIVVRFVPLSIKGNLKNSILNVGKLIGLLHTNVRYKRTSMRLSIYNFYYMSLYGLGLGLIWFGKFEAPLYLLSSYLLYLINQMFIRFADEESTIIVVTLAASAEVLLLPFNGFALLGLVVVANPLLNIHRTGSYVFPKVFKPFDVEMLLVPLRDFLDIPKNSRVLFAFSDPLGKYESIFDGYRIMLEAPLLVAAEKEIHLFPDWYAVQETNYDGAPSIWGRSINEVCSNVEYWDAEYILLYQDSGTKLHSDWNLKFKIISEFDWTNLLQDDEMRSLIPKSLKPPKWWLLKLRGSN